MRLSREKKVAGSLGAAVLVAAGVVGLGTSANAFGPAAESLGCRVYFGDTGTGDIATTYNDTFALTASDTTPEPGDTVTVTFSGTTGFSNGPIPIPAGSLSPSATIDVSGATTDTLSLTTAASYPAAVVPGSGTSGPYTLTGTFVADEGTTVLAFEQLRFNDSGANNADTYCTDADTNLTTGVDPKAAPVVSSVITETVTATAGTDTSSPTGEPSGTVTVTVTPPTVTVTPPPVTVTQTVPGATVTQTVTGPAQTVTQTITAPPVTVTATQTVPGPTVTVTGTPDDCKPQKPDYGHPHSKHHKKGKKHHQHGYGNGHGDRDGRYDRAGWNGGGDRDRYGHPHSVHHRGYDRSGYGHDHHDDCDENGTDTVAFAGMSDVGGGTTGGGTAAALGLGAAALLGAAFLGVGASRRPRGQHS